jgi:uncharacterized membrane protein
MNDYPEVVAKIASDYLGRVKSQLRLVPAREQDEFLRELQSHLYEAYNQTAGEDDVARILAVLRNLGEPAEVVADRLPKAMVRSGTRWNLPLYVLAGITIAMFGIPLGIGGVGVLVGLLIALVGIVFAFYMLAGSFLLAGAVLMSMGLIRVVLPELWDKLMMLGVIQINGPAEFFNHLSPTGQAFVLIVVASAFLASGLGLLRLGKYLLRGLRFLVSLIFDGVRRFAQTVRRKLRRDKGEGLPVSQVSFSLPGSPKSSSRDYNSAS